MCMCGKPTLNGESGYSWNGERAHVRPVDPPVLEGGDELLYDEPGRCGGVDSHCHHLRVVKSRYDGFKLLVRHGGGDERIDLGCVALDGLAALDSNARYWLLLRLYRVQSNAASRAIEKCDVAWRVAAAEKRIKTRKTSRGVKVWVEYPPSNVGA